MSTILTNRINGPKLVVTNQITVWTNNGRRHYKSVCKIFKYSILQKKKKFTKMKVMTHIGPLNSQIRGGVVNKKQFNFNS